MYGSNKEINIKALKQIRDKLMLAKASPIVVSIVGKPRTGKSTFAPWLRDAIEELFFGMPVKCYNLDKFPKIKIEGTTILEGIRAVSYGETLNYKPYLIIKLIADEETRKDNNRLSKRFMDLLGMLFHPSWWNNYSKEDYVEDLEHITIDMSKKCRLTKKEVYESITNLSPSNSI